MCIRDRDNRFFSNCVNAGERLVHYIQLALLSECPGQKDSLLLPSGEIAYLTVGKVEHTYFFQALAGNFTISLADSLEPIELSVPSHQYHVHYRDRKIPIH